MRELSEKNPYWLPKYRYLEMKNFALQYNYWKERINAIDIVGGVPIDHVSSGISDPVPSIVESRDQYICYIRMVENAADLTDDILGCYVLLGATKPCTYDNLKLMYSIPCGRDMYFNNLRKFYYILSELRK